MVHGLAVVSSNKKKNVDIREFGVKIEIGVEKLNLEISTNVDRLTPEKLKPNPIIINQTTIKNCLGTLPRKSKSQSDMKTPKIRTPVSQKKQNLKTSKKKKNVKVNKIVNYFLPFREKIENLPPDNNLKSLEKKEQIGEENTNLNFLNSSN